MPDNTTRWLYLFETIGAQQTQDALLQIAETTQRASQTAVQSLDDWRRALQQAQTDMAAITGGLATSTERVLTSTVFRGLPIGATPTGGLPPDAADYLRQIATTVTTSYKDIVGEEEVLRTVTEKTNVTLNEQGVAVKRVVDRLVELNGVLTDTSRFEEQLQAAVQTQTGRMDTGATYRGVPVGGTPAFGMPADQYLRLRQYEVTSVVPEGEKYAGATQVDKVSEALDNQQQVMGKVIDRTVSLNGVVQEQGRIYEEGEKAVGAFTSRFARHLTWIAQGMLIWGSLRLVKQVIGDWVDVQRELDQELGYFQIAMGDSQAAMDEYVDTVMELSRAYALMPEQVAPGVTTAYRAGEQDIAPYAAAFTRLTGVDMATSMRELIALHKQFPDRSMIDLLDAWTTAWAGSTMTMGEFTTMFESAGGLALQFNTNFETVAQLMAHISEVTSESGNTVERFTRMLANFYEEGNKTKEVTEALIGSTVTYTAAGMAMRRPIEDIIQAISKLTMAQKNMIAETLPSGLGQQWQQWFSMIVDGFEVAQTEAGSFNKGVETMSDRFSATVDGMTTAWKRFLLTLGDTEGMSQFVRNITWVIGEMSQRTQFFEEKQKYEKDYPVSPRDVLEGQGLWGQWVRFLGGREGPDIPAQEPFPDYQLWLRQRETQRQVAMGGPGAPQPGTPQAIAQQQAGYPLLPEGRITLPEGTDFAKLQEDITAESLKIYQGAVDIGHSFGAAFEDMHNLVTVVDEFGVPIAVIDLRLVSATRAAEMFADSMDVFLTKLTGPIDLGEFDRAMRERHDFYKEHGLDVGEPAQAVIETPVGPQVVEGPEKLLRDVIARYGEEQKERTIGGVLELPSGLGVSLEELQARLYEVAGEYAAEATARGALISSTGALQLVTDEAGNVLGTIFIPGLVNVGNIMQQMEGLPRQFFQGGVAEWEMTKLLYGAYEERYRQYEVPMGEEREYIGPTGEKETFRTAPLADASATITTQLGYLTDGARELTRWQDRQTEAYKRGVAAWESAITGLPGVSGPTPVTAYDMALTGVGLYQDKWDEPVRQMRQNVEDINAGRPPEYGDIWSKPWVQDIFAPIMGQGPEAMKGGLAMYEGGYYGLTQPWEAYEPQLPTLEREMETWLAGREQKQVNLGKIEEHLISKGYGPGDVGGFVEAVDMPPGLKAIIGDMTPEEYIDKVKSLGLETGGALTTSLTEELAKTPWILKVISSWQTGVEEQSALFDTLGFTMGSTAQGGFMRGLTDDMIGALVQTVLDALADEGYE